MALAVALKQDGKIYMGFAKSSTVAGFKNIKESKTSSELFKQKDVDNTLMVAVGKVRENNVLKFADLITEEEKDEEIDYEFMVTKIVPRIFEALNKDLLLMKPNDDSPYMFSRIILSSKDKLFYIHTEGAVVEIDNYFSTGGGSESAQASFLLTEGMKDGEKRVLLALKAGMEESVEVGYPFIISNTEDTEIKFLTEKEVEERINE